MIKHSASVQFSSVQLKTHSNLTPLLFFLFLGTFSRMDNWIDMTELIMDPIFAQTIKKNLLHQLNILQVNDCDALNLQLEQSACSVHSLMCLSLILLTCLLTIRCLSVFLVVPVTLLWLVVWFRAKDTQQGRTMLHHIHTVGRYMRATGGGSFVQLHC